jgi:hypothetical protein
MKQDTDTPKQPMTFGAKYGLAWAVGFWQVRWRRPN